MPVQPVGLRAGDRDVLESCVRSSAIRSGLAQRARIVLLAADGMSNTAIAEQVGVSRPTVISWRQRNAAGGLAGLDDRPNSGRPRTVDRAKILSQTLTPPPARLGVSHWSSRLLAEHLRTNQSSVSDLAALRVQPWRVQTFKFSTDPELIAKVTDVVGLYLAPAGERDCAVCGRVGSGCGAYPFRVNGAFPQPARRTGYVDLSITGSEGARCSNAPGLPDEVRFGITKPYVAAPSPL